MVVNLLGDYRKESNLDEVFQKFSALGLRKYFLEKNYGDGLKVVAIFLMCQDPALNLKQRIRHSKKDKILYMDLMLDLGTMVQADEASRLKLVARKMISEIPEIFSKYKLPDFDKEEFIADFKSWIEKNIIL
jgi:hypothetical protein